MSLTLTVTENVTNLNLTVTQDGVSVTVQPTVTIDAKVGLTSNSVGLNELKTELKAVHTIVSDVIDWNAGSAGLRTFTGTPVVVFTETNVPSSTVNKTITVEMTGAVTSIAFPSNYKKAVNASEDYDGTKRNVYVFDYVNGNVYYSNTLFPI